MNRFFFKRLVVAAIGVLFFTSCSHAGGEESEDSDTSTHTDSDTDSSSDSDTDSDTGSDPGDDNSDPDCPACYWNSGYPCGCNFVVTEGVCEDGSMCASTNADFLFGACLLPCETNKDCEAAAADWEGCGGIPSCAFVSAESDDRFCGYVCYADDDCPPGMYCDHTFDKLSLCLGVGNI